MSDKNHPKSGTNCGFRIVPIVLCTFAVFGLVFWQHLVSTKEIDVCQSILDQQQRQIEIMHAARDHWELLQNDLEGYNTQIENLLRVLPMEIDIDAVFSGAETWLGEQGLQLCGRDVDEVEREFYREAALELVICGSGVERERLLAEPGMLADIAGPRLVKLGEIEPVNEQLRAPITIYSSIVIKRGKGQDWCDRDQWPPIKTWLPPLSGWAKHARERLDELCPEIEQNRKLIAAVEELEEKRELLLVNAEIITSLIERGGAQTSEKIPESVDVLLSPREL